MRDPSSIVWYVALVAILAAGALVGGFLISRFLRGRIARAGHAEAPFTLADLRAMRSSGQITDQEFESMRAAIIGHVRAQADRPASNDPRASAPPSRDDFPLPGEDDA